MPQTTVLQRVVGASPILLLLGLMLRVLPFAIPVGPLLNPMQESSRFSFPHDSSISGVPLRASFYHAPVLDDALSHITIAFAQLQLWPADPSAWWQSLVFLTEYAGLYAVLLLEGCRVGNKGSLLQL